MNGWSVEADLVVGADGIRSVVRQSLETDQPRFSGQSIYRGLVDARSVPHLVADPAVRLWLGPGQHVVCYPVSGGRLVNVGATVPSEDWRDKDWQVESWSAPGDHAALVAAYQGWHAEVRRLIDALDPERLRRWALHDRDDVGRWHGHRTVLVGDAAHPMLPFLAQGANQAIEDAAVLAGCLTTGDLTFGNVSFDNVSSALARYEELRRPRAAEVQRLSRRNTTRLHTTEHLTEEHQTEELARSQRLAEQDWLYGYDADEVLGAAHSR